MQHSICKIATMRNITNELRRRRLREVVDKITADGGGLRMAENLSREELYDRGRARAEAKGEK